MTDEKKAELSAKANEIKADVYKILKPRGFRKHGATLHRVVSEDIAQVINFQRGEAYRGDTHLMWVNLGIRVPESFEHTFSPSAPKKYYHEYECNIRSRLGRIDGKEEKCFDLNGDITAFKQEIISEIEQKVLPVFDILSSREAILEKRRDYPDFDTMNRHMILLEEAMIYGHMGDLEKAKECFEKHFRRVTEENANRGHIEYLEELADKLGLME